MWHRFWLSLLMSLLLVLVGCGEQPPRFTANASGASPTAPTQQQVTPTVQTQVELPQPPVQTTPPTNTVTWEGIIITVPPEHVWTAGAYGAEAAYSAPVIAQGRLKFEPTLATYEIERPDGIGFTIVQFSGSLDDWLAAEQVHRSGGSAVDPQTIRETVIAGRPARAYSAMVIGVARSEVYAIKISGNRLLLIESSDADNPNYQMVVETLSVQE